MKRVTIKDIAARLGLSASTVSRALSGDRNIRSATREKVLATAREMGYNPNLAATSMKTGRTRTIGVVVPEMNTSYTIKVIQGVQDVFYSLGLRVIVADSAEDPARERENLLMMERFMVDGIIFCQCSYRHNRDTLERLIAERVPLVCFGRISHGIDVSKVIVDDYAKSFFVVERMILSGCRRICHFTGPEEVYNTVERARGYRDAMEKYKLEAREIDGGMVREDGRDAVNRMMETGETFDGIFAFNEAVGVGTMNRLREIGLRIPEDISVAAFSGTDLSTAVFPQLTTVEPPMFEMGRTAARLILDKIKNPSSESRTVVLNAEIKLRQSTDKK